jgi:hypothetical protein
VRYPLDNDLQIRIEDEEADSLAFQQQLPDRLLKKIVNDLLGNRQLETSVRLTLLQDVVIEGELPEGFLKVIDL